MWPSFHLLLGVSGYQGRTDLRVESTGYREESEEICPVQYIDKQFFLLYCHEREYEHV